LLSELFAPLAKGTTSFFSQAWPDTNFSYRPFISMY
jgi:hypothetical protein